jgi:enoyl-CoA hydratase
MIHTQWHDGVVQVTIDRPERRNALDHDALDGLLGAIDEAVSRRARVLVLGGAGGHFCAGADLTTVEDDRFVATLRRVLVGLHGAPFPTVAGIEGAALGAGTQLAVACDLRVATDDASLGIPAGKLGLMVDQWTVRRLTAVVGEPVARAMFLAARVYTGEEALRIGFVQRSGGVAEALEWAAEIARLAPLSLAGHKVGLAELDPDAPTSDAYAEAWTAAWSSEDLREGLAAFGDRRRPSFEGR